MCGRYALYGPRKRTRAETEYFSSIEQMPGSWNVAPTHMQPITRLHEGAIDQITARWGLIPHWAKDEKIGFKCINARAETVATSPSFRGSFKLGHRCLVPASGFFEWETQPDGKQPYYFTSAEGSLLAFAGLRDWWGGVSASQKVSGTRCRIHGSRNGNRRKRGRAHHPADQVGAEDWFWRGREGG